MPEGGTLTIRAENLHIDESYARMIAKAKPGPHVLLTVCDTGTGIPRENIDRIFDPFFTTKETGKGTGLGLSVVLGIVESHGGFINVYSQIGQGAEFKIYFPALTDQLTPKEPSNPAALAKGKGETILVVDDEESIRKTLTAILKNYGYNVLSAADGAQAARLFAIHRNQINLVLTDLAMPGMDGIALAEALKKLAPQIKIIVSTGFGQSQAIPRLNSLGVQAVLQKPYTAEAVLLTLRQTLAP
jgi:hypothetical protein